MKKGVVELISSLYLDLKCLFNQGKVTWLWWIVWNLESPITSSLSLFLKTRDGRAAEKNWLDGPINAVLYRKEGKREDIALLPWRFYYGNHDFNGFHLNYFQSSALQVSRLKSYIFLRNWNTGCQKSFPCKKVSYVSLLPFVVAHRQGMKDRKSRRKQWKSFPEKDILRQKSPKGLHLCSEFFVHRYDAFTSTTMWQLVLTPPPKPRVESTLVFSLPFSRFGRPLARRKAVSYVCLAVALKMVANLLLLGVVIWLLGTCCLGTNDKALLSKEKERSRPGSNTSSKVVLIFPSFQ